MSVTVEEAFDRLNGMYPTVGKGPSGWTGKRYFRVSSSDPLVVAAQVGAALPDIGDAWDSGGFAVAGPPGLLVTSIEMDPMGGTDDAIAGTVGWHRVTVNYGESQAGGPFEQAQPVGTSYTEIKVATGSVGAGETVDFKPIPPDAGVNSEQNTCELKVTSVRADIQAVTEFLKIANRINDNAVTLPVVRGLTGASGEITAQPGQLLARGVEIIDQTAGKVRLQFTFGYGPLIPAPPQGYMLSPTGPSVTTPASPWIGRYRAKDADGNFVGGVILADVQGKAAYPAPGVLW